MFEDPVLISVDPVYEPVLKIGSLRLRQLDTLSSLQKVERELLPLQTRVDKLNKQLVGDRLALGEMLQVLEEAARDHGERAPMEVMPDLAGVLVFRRRIHSRLVSVDEALKHRDDLESSVSLLRRTAADLDLQIEGQTLSYAAATSSACDVTSEEVVARLNRLMHELDVAEKAVVEVAEAVTEAASPPHAATSAPAPEIDILQTLEEMRVQLNELYLNVTRLDFAAERTFTWLSVVRSVDDVRVATKAGLAELAGHWPA
jgi:hypothetical protein